MKDDDELLQKNIYQLKDESAVSLIETKGSRKINYRADLSTTVLYRSIARGNVQNVERLLKLKISMTEPYYCITKRLEPDEKVIGYLAALERQKFLPLDFCDPKNPCIHNPGKICPVAPCKENSCTISCTRCAITVMMVAHGASPQRAHQWICQRAENHIVGTLENLSIPKVVGLMVWQYVFPAPIKLKAASTPIIEEPTIDHDACDQEIWEVPS